MHKNDKWLASAREEGIPYQREVQLTWWSVLQGIVVSEFIIKVPVLLQKIYFSKDYYLIWYIIGTLLILVNVWVQVAWAIIFLRWPLNISHVLLTTLLGTVSIGIVAYVEQPLLWVASTIAIASMGIAVYLYNVKRKAYLAVGLQYGWKPIIEMSTFLIALFLLFIWLLAGSQEAIGWAGFSVSILAGIALRRQSQRMEYERSQSGIP